MTSYPMLLALLAHFISDFSLQSDFLAKYKGKSSYVMFVHCFIWAGCVSLALEACGLFSIPKFIFLLGGHWLCDHIKCVLVEDWDNALARTLLAPRRHMLNCKLALCVDQAWHMLQLMIVVWA